MGKPANRVLTTRTILLWAVGLVLVAGASAALLLTTLGGGSPQDTSRLDALRTAANIVVGTGGAAALLLAARKQRSTELDLVQKDHDATQRRVTEMYGKAADQLGSDKAPVRLAGLYALERLAHDYEPQRQTIVNVLCAYLRMPFEPTESSPENLAEFQQERQVRLTAARVLTLHLRPDEPAFWPDIDLDLAGATLHGLTLTRCRIRSAVFYQAIFADAATFRGTTFTSKADFKSARFKSLADFRSVTFEGLGAFAGTVFGGEVDFGEKTVAKLDGALTTAAAGKKIRRKWPLGWEEGQNSNPLGMTELCRKSSALPGVGGNVSVPKGDHRTDSA